MAKGYEARDEKKKMAMTATTTTLRREEEKEVEVSSAIPATVASAGEVERAYASTCRLRNLATSFMERFSRGGEADRSLMTKGRVVKLPRTSEERLAEARPSLRSSSTTLVKKRGIIRDLKSDAKVGGIDKEKTYLYLAYGSNLAASTFLVSRGIKPLSSLPITCPTLRLTFDLPGLPYNEPCFANTARRDPSNPGYDNPTGDPVWNRGLVGVVYEVTASDYAHIIKTEGGGSSYMDIEVVCYALRAEDGDEVPEAPITQPFLAHTLFAPYEEDDDEDEEKKESSKGRFHRPSPTWAQPSPRYLSLLTTGASEHSLPLTYQHYLSSLTPYRSTSPKQTLGRFVLLAAFGPFLALLLGLMRIFADEKGRAPKWLGWFSRALVEGMWGFYDGVMKPVFGEGERSVEKEGGRDGRKEGEMGRRRWSLSGKRSVGFCSRDEEEVLLK